MTFKVHTLGCKVNTYESEFIIKEFIDKGYILIDDNSKKADIYIINTCTVTNTADAKSRKVIRQAKKENKDAIVVCMGCYTQIRKNCDDILNYADIIIGNSNKSKIVSLVEEFIRDKKKKILIEDVSKTGFEDMEMNAFNTRTRALIKIQDGCENYCTYCIIPFVRGKVRSKDPKVVIKEAEKLAQNGYLEIVLTGIHTGHYGSDLDGYDFSDLLYDLNNIDNLKRIRISSIEITELNDKFLKALKECSKIADHLHIPLQAGSDKILKLMNRKYDKEYYYKKIEEIRKIRPEIAITTDVIVGFPNEDEEDFNETIDFVKKVKFAKGHVFPFSERKGTKASLMQGKLSNDVKKARCKKLIDVFSFLEQEYYRKNIGKTLNIVCESYDDGYLYGHSDNYLSVKIKSNENLVGKMVLVLARDYENHKIIGTLKK